MRQSLPSKQMIYYLHGCTQCCHHQGREGCSQGSWHAYEHAHRQSLLEPHPHPGPTVWGLLNFVLIYSWVMSCNGSLSGIHSSQLSTAMIQLTGQIQLPQVTPHWDCTRGAPYCWCIDGVSRNIWIQSISPPRSLRHQIQGRPLRSTFAMEEATSPHSWAQMEVPAEPTPLTSSDTFQEYNLVIRKQVKLWIIMKSDIRVMGQVYNLPHQAVVKQQKETTKVRVVTVMLACPQAHSF